jgi:diguanylate cyclase (GGDEF)-like protein
VSGDRSVTVTISMGVVSLPLDEVSTVEDFVELTDRRMYQAKQEGRNQTVFE